MVEIKIACQCGVPFRYGLELANGRAPEGVGCPTCNAPVTPACNTLVDYLTGRLPNPASSGTRVLKDIKVTCACGARYKFELELGENTMPAPVVCPACQAELNEPANQELARFSTRFTDILPLSSVAAPAAPPVTTAPTLPATETPAAIPASAPETPPASSIAAAAAATALPVPASPAPAPAAAAPPDAPAIASPGTERTIPEFAPLFPTAESSKSPPKGMPNLKPLEVPRMERPVRPAGSTPPAAKPPAAASGAAPATAPGQPRPDTSPTAKADAKPAAAKPAAKPVVKVEAVRDVNVPLGAVGAFVGAILGAGIWFAVLKLAPMGGAWMALLVGVFAGLGARLLGRGSSQALGAVACGMSVVFILVMSWITIGHHVNRIAQPFLKGRYESIMAEAKEAVEAKSDVDLKRVVARSVPAADPTMILVSEADLKSFKEQRMPFLRDMASGKISKEQFESRELAKYRSNYPLDEAWDAAIGIVGLLCALAGIIAGAKIAFKRT